MVKTRYEGEKEINSVGNDYFYIEAEDWEFAVWCARNDKPLLLVGETGTGKTQLAYTVAKYLGMNFHYVNLGATSDPKASLLGVTHLDLDNGGEGRGTVFIESDFLRGIADDNGLVLMDELNRAPADSTNYLYPLLGNDDINQITVDESRPPRVVKRKASLFATANNLGSFEYSGTKRMDRAWLDRWYIVFVKLPPAEELVKILVDRTGCEEVIANYVVDFSQEIQKQYAVGELSTSVSTRMLIRAAEAASTFNLRKALEVSIANFFQESSEQILVRQIMQKY